MASSNVRDVVQTVMDGLAVVKESLPDGNWQQIAAHLAAPGQQQISHQLQQIPGHAGTNAGDPAANAGDDGTNAGDDGTIAGRFYRHEVESSK